MSTKNTKFFFAYALPNFLSLPTFLAIMYYTLILLAFILS